MFFCFVYFVVFMGWNFKYLIQVPYWGHNCPFGENFNVVVWDGLGYSKGLLLNIQYWFPFRDLAAYVSNILMMFYIVYYVEFILCPKKMNSYSLWGPELPLNQYFNDVFLWQKIIVNFQEGCSIMAVSASVGDTLILL